MNEPNKLPSLSSRSPTLVKNMISGLSYGALNASYQVTGPCPEPTSQSPFPSALFPFHTQLARRRDLPPPSLQRAHL